MHRIYSNRNPSRFCAVARTVHPDVFASQGMHLVAFFVRCFVVVVFEKCLDSASPNRFDWDFHWLCYLISVYVFCVRSDPNVNNSHIKPQFNWNALIPLLFACTKWHYTQSKRGMERKKSAHAHQNDYWNILNKSDFAVGVCIFARFIFHWAQTIEHWTKIDCGQWFW